MTMTSFPAGTIANRSHGRVTLRRKGGRPGVTGGLRCCLSGTFEEGEQVRVDQLLVGRAHTVRQARIDFQCGSFNNLRREKGRGADGHDLVVIAMEDERWHIELLQV